MKGSRKIYFIFIPIWFWQIGPAVDCSAQLYHLNWKNEKAYFAADALLLTVGFLAYTTVPSVTETDLTKLNADRLPAWDRPAINQWSPSLADASDMLLITVSTLPLLFLASSQTRKNTVEIAAMYAEAMGATIGLQYLVKGLTRRVRPYAYNPYVPLSEKLDPDTRRSFYSGHAALSFCSAVFVSQVYSEHFPHSAWRALVWAGSLALAAEVGYLRYASGKHFPSDIIAGALAGAMAGYWFPSWHRFKSRSMAMIAPNLEGDLLRIEIFLQL